MINLTYNKRLIGYFIQNPCQMRQGHTIVGHRHMALPCPLNACQDKLAVEHAAAALDNQVVAGQIIRKIRAADHINLHALPKARPISSFRGAWVQHSAISTLDLSVRLSICRAPSI